MAVKFNLKIRQGNTFRKPMRYRRKVGDTTPPVYEPINISGALIALELMPEGTTSKQTFSTTTRHIILTNPTQGEFVIDLLPEVTDTFNWAKAKYVLNMRHANGDFITLMEGTILCSRKL